MEPTDFDEANAVLSKPKSLSYDQCHVLCVCQCAIDGLECFVSCWKPTLEEMELIQRTGRVWLIAVGDAMPPVRLQAEKPEGMGG